MRTMRAGGGDRGRPAAADQAGRLHGAGEPADQGGRPGPVRPQREHLPRVRVGGARLGVQIVPVVPDDDQAQVAHRGEHRRPGCRRPPGPAPGRRPASAGTVRRARGQPPGRRACPAPSMPASACVDQAQVPGVGHHDHGAPPAGRGGRRGQRDLVGPVRPGQCRPDRARRPPVREGGQEGRACLVPGPRPRLRRPWPPAARVSPAPDHRLGRHHPRRHRPGRHRPGRHRARRQRAGRLRPRRAGAG